MEVVRSLVAACVVVLAGCAPQTANSPTAVPSDASRDVGSTTPSPLVFTVAKGTKEIGGCGSTRVYEAGGEVPATLTQAGGGTIPQTPYVVADPPIIAAFLFDYPLRAQSSTVAYNKILWIVGTARTGPLEIDGHPSGAASPVVRYSDPVDPNYRSAGEVYITQINVPSPGCWQFTLRWAGQHAEVDLEFTGSP